MLSDAVNAVIGDIYCCALDGSLWQPTLHTLSRLIGGVGAAIVPTELHDSSLRFGSAHVPESDHIYYNHMWRHDPYRTHLAGHPLPEGEVSDISFLSDEEMARSPYYQEFLNRFDASRTNRFYFTDPSGPHFAFSIQRPLGQPHETDAQRRLRLMLGQHVCRALSMSIAGQQANVLAHGFRELCARLPNPTAVVGQDGRVLFMNDAMERMLGDGVIHVDGRITCSHRASARQLDALVHDALHPAPDAAPPERFVMVTCPSGRPLLARAIPFLPDGRDTRSRPARAMALLALHRPGSDMPDVTDALRLLGLNHSEARLVQQVANGFALKEAARNIGVSDHYARTMLRSVYEKLDVNSQGRLVAFVRDLPTACPPPRS
ncbi:hypothetical protein CFR73_04375 [Novacetimonas maltaceti]|uniref:HTH luxR-type domain-containing protein n=1 Tax=Novacetimonas maltaceti TaxID=1203393 RepID=A0A2S3W348_9PROT|nr:PAS domain-containing protein [Novacetimonas maltaceti]POF63291.1 hypothetical protein KMAL_10220 [Novacetimonas maltaceti]PYD61295.1 hypothetical protein CFR73_04375 [Novacetimonas maltaceti]